MVKKKKKLREVSVCRELVKDEDFQGSVNESKKDDALKFGSI